MSNGKGAATLFAALKLYVEDKTTKILDRIKTLEARPSPERGEPGPPGVQGERGEAGIDGKDGVSVDTAALNATIEALVVESTQKAVGSIEIKHGKDGRDGVDGKDGAPGVDGSPGVDGKDGAPGVDGKSVTLDEIREFAVPFINNAVEALPKPRDGIDGKDGVDGVNGKDAEITDELVERIIDNTVPRALAVILPGIQHGRDGIDGKTPDESELRSLIVPIVKEVADAIPVPKDGRDGVDGKDGAPGVSGVDGKDGAPGVDGITPSDEVVQRLLSPMAKEFFDALPRPKDGRDGVDGKDGVSITEEQALTLLTKVFENHAAKWEREFERRATDYWVKLLATLPKPADGKDGKDGLSLDDIDVQIDDEFRTFKLSLIHDGQVVKSIEKNVPTPIHRGAWKAGLHKKGDMTTWGGSTFVAMRDTDKQPETDDSWKLCVKRGRDGRDGRNGKDGAPAPVKLGGK